MYYEDVIMYFRNLGGVIDPGLEINWFICRWHLTVKLCS